MILVKVKDRTTALNQHMLVQHGRVVASWADSTMWGSAVQQLLERLDFRVEQVDATGMVESFRRFEGYDSPEWEVPALVQEVIEEFGVESLGQPLDHDQAAHLWEKARVLDGLFLERDIHL